MSFSNLGLSAELLRALEENKYTQATPIQQQAIPLALKHKDLMAAAQTGTGKTAAFVIPLLERLNDASKAQKSHCRALIISPTRELAAQTHKAIKQLGKYLPIRSTVVFGGVKIQPQIKALQRGIDILVATPGRLLDLHQQRAIRFDTTQTLVLDEADRMLDMGFMPDIQRILTLLPKKRQTWMFSATFSGNIKKLAHTMLVNPEHIQIAPDISTATTVHHKLHPVDKDRKRELLKHLIITQNWHQALVFSRTKHGADKLAKVLDKAGIQTAVIHGNRSQNQRTRALDKFKKGKVQILVATDIAARGIDIKDLPQVVNFDLPTVAEDYVHRIGRTGRAGNEGWAISLVSADEGKQLFAIERFIKQSIEQEVIAGFEPSAPLKIQPQKKPQRQRSRATGKGNKHARRSSQGKATHARQRNRKAFKPKAQKSAHKSNHVA